ncbi:hypothetical protein [Streptomyces sp. NPDC017993]|uniref:hypothetical protein n=1 Tax=Streptomyces sp. NPDC017993 TaxID=3365027 RepID=UPI00379BBBB2
MRIATIHAPADHVHPRIPGLGTRVRALDKHTTRLDGADDHLPRITQTLAAIDTEYTLDADPAVLDHLRRSAHRLLQPTSWGTVTAGAARPDIPLRGGRGEVRERHTREPPDAPMPAQERSCELGGGKAEG